MSTWRCIPCGMTGNVGRFCFKCGRAQRDATDATRWQRFFGLDAEIVECPHRDVEQDDDGLNNRFYVCTECERVVVPTLPDEDNQSYWETLE